MTGALDTTNANSGAWSAPVGVELEFGFTSGPTLRDYDGLLDDIRVYNRELTAAEVSTIYSSGALIDTNALQMQLNFTTPPVYGFALTWGAANSVLQSATVASGPYSDVTAAASPYYVVPRPGQKFYRYRFPNAPQSLVSNPYLM